MSSWLKFASLFLLLAVVLTLTYIFYTRPLATQPVEPAQLKFSQVSERTDAVAHYPQGAVIINTINDHPALLRVFDRAEIAGWLTPALLKAEATNLLKRQAVADEFSRSYIYQTSYYLGNLLVTPSQHLIEVLEARPATAHLIETALADGRAMTTQLQDVFDVPPPRFYEPGLEAGLFYTHPSFPSLVGAEAYLIYLLLAEIDPKNARHYALQAGQFVAALRASATHYDFDIDYALELSARLMSIIVNHPGYQEFLTAARAEWVDYHPASVLTNVPTEVLPGFNFSRRISSSPRTESSVANLEGSLILALVDKRLPQASRRLYELSASDTRIIPFALELTPRQYSSLLPSLGDFSPLVDDGYHFSAADFTLLNRFDRRLIHPTQAWTRQRLTATPRLVLTTAAGLLKQLRANRSGSHLLAWSKAGHLSLVVADTNQVLDLGPAQAVVWSGNEAVVFASEFGIERFSLNSQERTLLNLHELDFGDGTTKLVSDDVGNNLVVIKQKFDSGQLQFDAEFLSYRRDGEDWQLTARSRITDVKIESAVLSPDATQLAILTSDGLTNQSGSILLFDVKNGIIKKDIILTEFSSVNRSLEAWVF